MTAISLQSVSVSLGGKRVVDEINAEIANGEWVTLIGPNGAGKSTLLRAIAGLVDFEGQVELDGAPISSLGRREIARLLAFVPQSPLLPPEMTVREYVLLGRTPHIGPFGYESKHDVEAANRALERLELLSFAARPLRTLSGGEQQRTVLARALAQEAPLLLLDEPSFGLAPLVVQDIFAILRAVNRQEQTSILLVEQNAKLALRLADHAYVLETGRIALHGSAAEIGEKDSVRRIYLGY